MAIENVVLYHANCADGFCAAWVASQFLPREKTEFIPVQYGQVVPNFPTDVYLYIVDFCYPAHVLRGLLKQCRFMAVIDHHKTAESILNEIKKDGSDKLDVLFDVNESGASLTHRYFADNTDYHWLVEYTKDRDLWKWRLQDSKAINACLRSLPMTFEMWDSVATTVMVDGQKHWQKMIDQGSAILRNDSLTVDLHAHKAVARIISGNLVPIVNATTLFSEIAGKLAEGNLFAAAYFVREDGKVQWSLRSHAENGIDVSEIARSFGGGGHKNAAGFETDLDFLQLTLQQKG